MVNKISIDCLIFLDDDPVVFTEGIQKYRERHKSGKLIPPIRICHQHEDKYYARGGHHRTYMFYHRMRRRTIPVSFVRNPVLTGDDRYFIEHGGGVTIHDLEEHSIDEYPLDE